MWGDVKFTRDTADKEDLEALHRDGKANARQSETETEPDSGSNVSPSDHVNSQEVRSDLRARCERPPLGSEP